MEHSGDFSIVFNTQFYQRKDSELVAENLRPLGNDLLFRLETRVYHFNIMRKNIDESAVEIMEQLPPLFRSDLAGWTGQFKCLFRISFSEAGVNLGAKYVQSFYIR